MADARCNMQCSTCNLVAGRCMTAARSRLAQACNTSHICFTKVGEPKHLDSHFCFSKRAPAKLEPLESAGVIAALEDGISKLQILYQTLPVDRYEPEEEPYKSLEDRFSKEIVEPGKYLEFAGIWPMDLQAMLKLQKDRTFAERVLRKTLEDLRCHNRYGALHGAVALQIAKLADEQSVDEKLRDIKENEMYYKELLATEKELMLKQDVFWDQKEEELLAAYHDTRLISGLSVGLARQWEETRRLQLNHMKQRLEADLRNEIDEILENSIVDEDRVHAEIMSFLETEHESLKKDLDRWTDEYDEQIATRDSELNHLRSNKEANLEAIENAKKEIELRKEIKKKTLEMREKFEGEQSFFKKCQTIQAWWRGIFYRKDLQSKALKMIKQARKAAKKQNKGL